ncbi:nucleotidyltransferase domain-containing protein [Mycobacterium sp. Y57]|uniref:nucleotidyltransferase domain-containing protein n=1 Tax=Mycolicibacterium xanthum TaxID=2796469 RepID=UPI001C846F47|nr:nucleotidyltransferase domain-containing protein [Mycolicibacterium xanthum]MBX7432573.1 nucleotidyltransferase domain-containing protein [Mycolicibacterium xanthum]
MEFGRPFATVTPTLDGDVLAVLARDDVTFTTGQIHRILERFSEEGIRKVLSRLALQGVVHVERVGNTNAYRFNSDHLAADAIVELARLSSIFFTRLGELLDGWETPPVYGAVFGSAVTGSMTANSDIDLLLVKQDGTADEVWSRQIGELARTVTNWTGNDARPIEFTIAELIDARGEPVVRDVVDRGLTVAGTRAWLLRTVGMTRRAGRR